MARQPQEELALIYEWNEADCLRIARVRFRGPAQRWAQPRQFHDWDDFERQFLEQFGETPETAMVRLENCFQKTRESPKKFADRFLQEAERAGHRTDTALLHQFIRRLHPEFRLEVTRQRPTTMEDAIEFGNYSGANSEIATEEYTMAKQQHPAGQNGAYCRGEQSNRPPPFARHQDNRAFHSPSWRPRQGNKEHSGIQNRSPWTNRDGQFPPRNDQQQRPFNPPGANNNRPSQVSGNDAVDDLSRQLEKLQINLRQSDALREAQQQEITRLKAALRRPNDSIHLMETAWEQYEPACYDEYYDYDELMAKRPNPEDEDTPYVRMPHKRVAITPAGQSSYTAPRRVSPPPPPAAASPSPGPRIPVASAAVAQPPNLD
eukprot:gene3334-biopygen5021